MQKKVLFIALGAKHFSFITLACKLVLVSQLILALITPIKRVDEDQFVDALLIAGHISPVLSTLSTATSIS
jgi:hypothetical protein